MYSFIFYFIYSGRTKKDGEWLAAFTGKFVVAIALIRHLGLVYSICRFALCYFWQYSIARASVTATKNDYMKYYSLIGLIGIVTFSLFNKNRVEGVKIKYEGHNIYSLPNIAKFIALLLLPLLLGIFLVDKSVPYCN